MLKTWQVDHNLNVALGLFCTGLFVPVELHSLFRASSNPYFEAIRALYGSAGYHSSKLGRGWDAGAAMLGGHAHLSPS